MSEPMIPELDRVAFQQVWRRVMPEDRPDCPFTLEAPPLPTVTSTPVPLASTTPSTLARRAPAAQTRPCLGEESAGELPFLQEQLTAAAEGQRLYRAMARQSRRGTVFSGLAGAKGGQIRRLRAAYFLISGREAPALASGTGAMIRNLPQAVRARYHGEQAAALRLEEAAGRAADTCLAELYRALAAENRAQADQLRSWLEEG